MSWDAGILIRTGTDRTRREDSGPRAFPGNTRQRGNEMIETEENLTEKAKSDLLYLEQLNSYAENTKNTPEYIRAMAMYTQALHVIDESFHHATLYH